MDIPLRQYYFNHGGRDTASIEENILLVHLLPSALLL